MLILTPLLKIKDQILDLIFPVTCITCGVDGVFLCNQCRSKLPRIDKQKCAVCFSPAPFGKTHSECLSKKVIDGAIAALDYKNPNVKNIIETFKYRFISELSQPLGNIITEQLANLDLQSFFSEFTVIPVPLHKKRFNWRGFNQAELLAKELSDKMNLKLDKELVMRIRHTRPQVELSRDGRKENMTDAFQITSPVTLGKYLLIDDVITSGSTLNEIARILKQNGASEVWALTLAHG